ncbi:hypothetical protein HYU11_02345 [Candidatus Woesearchaeota archaeon]|nr:hypothetical protein [Candidatus Woesearchaeota archaeon]
MESVFAQKRKEGTLSLAHAELHATAVSNFGAATARALANAQGLNDVAERWAILAGAAFLLHDIERFPNEIVPHGPASAKYLHDISTECPWTELSPHELSSLEGAIREHESNFARIWGFFGEPFGLKGKILSSVMAHALLIGDKVMEQSGYGVLPRRCVFVGKERMLNDITMLQYPRDSHLAVLAETMIRLYERNPIDSYPGWIKGFAEEWHGIQYMFYKGLLEYCGTSEETFARLMHDVGFPKFNETVVEKVSAQQHLSGKYFRREEYPVLSKTVADISDLSRIRLSDLAESSYQLVHALATAEDPDGLISAFKPQETSLAYQAEFMTGIQAYRSGSGQLIRKLEEGIHAYHIQPAKN